MAEEKNNFINCKMNRDIDDRLLPNGQYREAINLQISRSEGANVGALQNVLGNELIIDFFEITEIPNLKSIGTYVDDNNNNIYIFLTDYTDNSGINTYNPYAYNFIYSYNTITNAVTKLVEGEWLNFSTTNPIYGINLLEDLLFWTDNRNQPRKINVVSATQTAGYYSSNFGTQEAQISVAKLNPWRPINLYKESELAPGEYETTMYDVTSEFLPGATGGGTAIVDASGGPSVTVTLNTVAPETFYPFPGQIISGLVPVTKVVSFDAETLILTVDVAQTWTVDEVLTFNANPYYNADYGGDSVFLQDKFVRFSYRFRFDDGEYSLIAPFTQPAFIPMQDGYFEYASYYDDPGPSIITNPGVDDETATYQSTIVNFMKNKVNNILLQITLPCDAGDLSGAYKITEMDILYKESDGLTIGVIDTIPVATIAASTISDLYEYNYESKKPYKTLPQSEITRVYDKVPIKALAQEVISNRVVYGNYQDKFSYPKYLDYTIGYKQKQAFDIDITNPTLDTTSYIEYPNHSVKQNRTYQVGLILSDQFGRSSGVILSNSTINTSVFGASTINIPYSSNGPSYDPWDFPGLALNIQFNTPILLSSPGQTMGFPGLYNSNTREATYNPLGWVSYKIVVKQTQQDYYNVYLPGVMAGYPQDNTPGLGVISHTILINDNINKVPRDLREVGPTQVQFSSSSILYPRVNNVITEPLPINTSAPFQPADPRSPIGNVQYYPGNTRVFVSTIATIDSLFDISTTVTSTLPEWQFYDVNSNPLVARLSTTQELGALAVDVTIPDYIEQQGSVYLAVYETKPVESKLDIYWETTSVGLIDQLNETIATGDCGAFTLSGWDYNQTEAFAIGTSVVGPFWPMTLEGNPITNSDITFTVTTPLGVDRTADFGLVKLENAGPTGQDIYFINTAVLFYFGVGATTTERFIFNLAVSSICPVNGELVTNTFSSTIGELTNIAPEITNWAPVITPSFPYSNVLYPFTGTNGVNATGSFSTTADLAWEVIGVTKDGLPYDPAQFFFGDGPTFLTPNTPGLLKCLDPSLLSGSYEMEIRLKDVQGGPGAKSDIRSFTLVFSDAITYYGYNNCLTTPYGDIDPQPMYTTYQQCAALTFQCKQFLITKITPGPVTLFYNSCNLGEPGTTTSLVITDTSENPFLLCAYNVLEWTGGTLTVNETGNVGACPY
jgi:hypothetical protein